MRDGIKKRIDTTLGDLIESLSEVAFEYCKDSTKAYTLVSVVLADLLSNSRSDLTPIQSGMRDKKSSIYNGKYFNRRQGLLCDDKTLNQKKGV